MKTALCIVFFSTLVLAETVPVPKTTRLGFTANSTPLNSASRDLQPLDLAARGYTEEEFIVSGTANVYDWAANGSLTVKTPKAPYADRILVRHPSARQRFSGTVVVELMNNARRFDWPMMWGYAHDYFIEHGDAWVGITLPGAVQGLKKFNPTRYQAVSFANPGAPCATGGKNAAPDQEEGLRWDLFSQVAAALKSGAPGSPLAGFKVERVFMTTQAGDIVTYINAIHSHATLANGKPAYDGYLIKNPSGAARISQCAANPGRDDPRRVVTPVNVPIVAVVAQGEVIGNLASRRPDSDDPNGRYRLYEIAGVAHIEKYPYSALPSFADQVAAVGAAQGTPEWPFNAKCNPDVPLGNDPLLKYSYDAAFLNLDQWVRKGTEPPKADRIQVKDGAIVLDEYGNGMGGVRSPFVDAPVATYFTTSPGPGTCAELGHTANFNAAQLKKLYPDAKSYSSKVAQSINQMAKERFLTEPDAKRLKAELLKNGK
ncbi:MAG TPA: alpha/beta hydrolase domain-containing protein [Bryobacteraceae bacterium]|jgi:hypothetical protein